jgi:hypothetical protein
MLDRWPATAPQRLAWRCILFVGAAYGLLLLVALARAPHRQQWDALFVSDGFGYYIYLPSLILDGDLDLSNQLRRQPDQLEQPWYQPVSQTGLRENVFQVGCAVLWLPFFLAAHAAVLALNALGASIPTTGFGIAYELPVYLGSFTYGLVGVYYLRRLLLELWGERVADGASLAIALATPLAAYLWFEPDMCHVVSMFLITVLVYRLHRMQQERDRRPLSWAGAGALTGLIVAIRAPDGLVVLAAAWVGLSILREDGPEGGKVYWKQGALAATAFVLAAFIGFLPQIVVWQIIYGEPLLVPTSSGYDVFNWQQPKLLRYLFSPERGVFAWSPLLLVAAAGCVLGFLRGPPVLRWSVPVLAAAIYYTSSLNIWWVGCSFGARRMVDYSVIFALGLGYLMHRYPAWASSRLTKGVAVGLGLYNWVLMVRYFAHDLPEYGALSWYDLVVRTFDYPWRTAVRFF